MTRSEGKRIRNKRTARAALLGALVLVSAPDGRTARADATPSAAPAAEATEAPAGETISMEDYFAGVSKPDLTDAKRAEFAAKHEGQKVAWSGYVRNLARNKSGAADTFLLILATSATTDPPPKGFVASFSAAHEKAVVGLKQGDKVTVSGTLATKQNPNVPVVQDATLAK